MRVQRIFNGLVAALVVLGVLEMITGLILLPMYEPSVKNAYASAERLPSALESIHHWLSALLIGVGALVILFGLISAAYRSNSKKLWIGSLILVLLAGLLQLTGHLLPWDVHAVRTAVVELGIANNAPVVGGLQANLLRGGSQLGPETLQIWYWAHVALLSVIWLGIGLYSLSKARKQGWSSKALIVGAVAMLICGIVFAFVAPVHLGSGATAADMQNYNAKPEWYILPLHGLLTLAQNIKPSLAFVGTMVIPAIALILIAAAPWLDRRAAMGKKPIYGPVLGAVLILAGAGLCIYSGENMASPVGPNNYPATATTGGPQVKLDQALVAAGSKLFTAQGCDDCHTVHGKGGSGGPLLDGTGTRHPDIQWQIQHLQNPSKMVPGSTMPSFSSLSQQDLKSLAEFLESLK